MIVPAAAAAGGGIGSGGAAGRVGANPPKPRGYIAIAPSGGLSPALQLLVGPVTPIGVTGYDTLHLTQSAAYETVDYSNGFWNFYDRALALYILYYRTGDTRWRDAARAIASVWAHDNLNRGDGTNGMANDPLHTGPLNMIEFSTLGLAVYYLDTGDVEAANCVERHALWGQYLWPLFDRHDGDARVAAYSMMAMLAAHVLGLGGTDTLGHTHAQAAALVLESFLSRQSGDITGGGTQTNSGWQNFDSGAQVPLGAYVSNFMNGLSAEALILYDRVIGDARIVPALKLWADWAWSTQWVPLGGGPARAAATSTTSLAIGTGTKVFTTQTGLTWYTAGHLFFAGSTGSPGNYFMGTVTSYSGTTLTANITEAVGSGSFTDWYLLAVGYPGGQSATGVGCFQYANILSGTESPGSDRTYACLTGLLVQAWGYLYAQGQGAAYKTNGDALLTAIQQAPFFDVKEFSQAFRASPRYLGWTA